MRHRQPKECRDWHDHPLIPSGRWVRGGVILYSTGPVTTCDKITAKGGVSAVLTKTERQRSCLLLALWGFSFLFLSTVTDFLPALGFVLSILARIWEEIFQAWPVGISRSLRNLFPRGGFYFNFFFFLFSPSSNPQKIFPFCPLAKQDQLRCVAAVRLRKTRVAQKGTRSLSLPSFESH